MIGQGNGAPCRRHLQTPEQTLAARGGRALIEHPARRAAAAYAAVGLGATRQDRTARSEQRRNLDLSASGVQGGFSWRAVVILA
eukprot:8987770-Pyramimonas_sp.AAC.1